MWFWLKSPRAGSATQVVRGTPVAADPEGLLRSVSAAQLLQPHQGLLYQLKELAGVTEPVFQGFYQAALVNLARFVQQLPASEVHHHAGPGGLLCHSLEVAVLALKIRRSYLFSAEGGAEVIARKADLWTYATFVGALCHDLAKPVLDQQVVIYTQPGQPGRLWQPFLQYIDEQGAFYQTRFNPDRRYRLHEKASPLLVYRVVPLVGLQWLSSDPAIFAQWLATLAGDQDGAESIGMIVHQADGQSVALNLGAGSGSAQRLSTVKTIALQDKLLTALRHLLSNGDLPLNRNGAAAWIYDGDCWLVSKRAVDTVRTHLQQEGHSGIPTQNSRFYDLLQEHGILVPCGDKAIWKAIVKDDGWQNTLTLIRIPVAKLWTHPDSQPEAFAGQVIPEAATREEELPFADTEAKVVPVNAVKRGLEPCELVQMAKHPPVTPGGTTAVDYLPALAAVDAEEAEQAQEDAGREPLPLTPAALTNSAVTAIKPAVVATRAVKTDTRRSERPANKDNDHAIRPDADMGDAFVAWIQRGLEYRTLIVNHADAKLHIVPEGLLLVTPGIFQSFAKHHQLDWIEVQKKVLQKEWHQRTTQGLNVFKYQVSGKQCTSTVNGVLFTDPTRWFGTVTIPLVNPYLKQLK